MERAGARYRGRDVQRRCRQNVGAQGVGRGRQQGRRFLSRQASKTRRREVGWKQNHFQMRRQLRDAIIEVTRAPTEADALCVATVALNAADQCLTVIEEGDFTRRVRERQFFGLPTSMFTPSLVISPETPGRSILATGLVLS